MLDIIIPSPGESITEVELTSWLVKDGDIVKKNQEIAEIESDKATLTLTAIEGGQIKIMIKEGETTEVGSIACQIDTSKANNEISKQKDEVQTEKTETIKSKTENLEKNNLENIKISPIAKKKMQEYNLNIEDVVKGLQRITSNDVEKVKNLSPFQPKPQSKKISRKETRSKMSQLRQKISERLVNVKNETAMLTTFNEVDMNAIMNLRKKYQNAFIEKHNVKLGFMSFFAKAASIALQSYPSINSMIDKNESIHFEYVDISIAVQTPKGLMVPVIRNVETLSLAEIERKLIELANKARDAKISLEEMTGGTFTITNGGVFGSMLSTPIINPPQSAILGMHNIVQRPVAINNKVEIRPMMYLAVSYDHRIVDGKNSVGFLIKIKEMLENPTQMLFGNDNADKVLLEIA